MDTIGYIRVSTHRQVNEGVSPETQRARIEAYCESRGWILAEGDLFQDAGLTGKRSDNRPGLQAALEKVCLKKGVLVVYSLSRLARSTTDALAIAERLRVARANLASISEDLNTTTATGKLIFRILAVLAEFERELISERTTNGLAYKRSLSQRLGQVPYGKTLDADGTTLVDDPAEADLFAYIAKRRSDGFSLRRIARELIAQGRPTKNGGANWSPSTVRRLGWQANV